MESLFVRPPVEGKEHELPFQITDILATSSGELRNWRLNGDPVPIHLKKDPHRAPIPKPDGKILIVLFGTTSLGHSCTTIVNYAPFVDIMVPRRAKDLHFQSQVKITADDIAVALEDSVRYRCEDDEFELDYTVLKLNRLFGAGFNSNGMFKDTWVRVRTDRVKIFNTIMGTIKSAKFSMRLAFPRGSKRPSDENRLRKVTLAADRMTHVMRFCSERRIRPTGWVTMKNVRNVPHRMFSTQLQWIADVETYECPDVAPMVIASFDLECVPELNDNFPDRHRTKDKIVQIGVALGI